MKKFTKQLLCAVLTLVIVLSFAACGAPSLEGGVWYKEGSEGVGYRFREIQEKADGREMGLVDRIGSNSSSVLTSYYYYFSGEEQITIVKQVTTITSNRVREDVHDVMQITEADGQRILISQNSGERFLFSAE